jgi:aminoglycoside/choline kinase family phosphotransferase
MTARESLINTFLASTPWQNAQRQPLDQDASFRRYWRLTMNGKSAILMDAPPPEKPVSQFAEIACFLRRNKLSAPQIYDIDQKHGLLLIEDFGDATFTRVLISDPGTERSLYDLAIDTLLKIHRIDSYQGLSLANYDIPTLIDEARLFIKWFYPAMNGGPATAQQSRQFAQAWHQSIEALAPHKRVLVLRDFHVDNLMYTLQSDQTIRCGLLDFQDALMGSPAYDLMSLIEDARRDISCKLRTRCLSRYFTAIAEQKDFPTQHELMPWLNVLAAQRHAKVLGIFIRLYKRDKKANYLKHLPRVLALYTAAIEREPVLNPVSQWMAENLPLADVNLNGTQYFQ